MGRSTPPARTKLGRSGEPGSFVGRLPLDKARDAAGEPQTDSRDDNAPTIHGRIVVTDEQGVERVKENGSFVCLSWNRSSDGRPLGVVGESLVEVHEGRFKVRMAPDRFFDLQELVLGGRVAVLNLNTPLPVDSRHSIELRASWLHRVLLQVVDAASGDPLFGLDIVESPETYREGTGAVEDLCTSKVLYSNAVSPVRISPEDFEFLDSEYGVVVWVHAPGYAWSHVQINFGSEREKVLALKAAAELAVTLVNYAPPPPARKGLPAAITPVLRVRSLPVGVAAKLEKRATTPGEAEPPPLDEDDPPAEFAWLEANPQLLGEVLVEQELGRTIENPIMITDLEPGWVAVSVELGEWYEEETLQDLGTVPVRMVAGERTNVSIVVRRLPVPGASVPLAGTLLVPTEWGVDALELGLSPKRVTGGGRKIIIPIEEMTPVPASEGVFQWSAGRVLPGLYRAWVYECPHEEEILVPEGGLRDARIEIGAPTKTVVRFIGQDTGEPIPVRFLLWSPGRESGQGLFYHPEEAEGETGVFRITAPVGRARLQGSSRYYKSHIGFHDIHPGDNEIVITLEKLLGIDLEVRVDGRPAPLHLIEKHLHIEGSEGELSWGHYQGVINLPRPGTYKLRLDPLDGYAPVDPGRVEVHPHEFVRYVVELEQLP